MSGILNEADIKPRIWLDYTKDPVICVPSIQLPLFVQCRQGVFWCFVFFYMSGFFPDNHIIKVSGEKYRVWWINPPGAETYSATTLPPENGTDTDPDSWSLFFPQNTRGNSSIRSCGHWWIYIKHIPCSLSLQLFQLIDWHLYWCNS